MQTYAEKGLIKAIALKLHRQSGLRILNIGSSGSLVIEKELVADGCDFIVDHLDIDTREAAFDKLDRTFTESAEDMKSVPDAEYDVCFSNFVWEHIPDVNRALKEAYRVTKSNGSFFFTVPNPFAPEFLVIRCIPLWLRHRLKGYEVWPTYYNYKSISSLKKRCEEVGFSNVRVAMYPAVFTYTYRTPVLKYIGKFYDVLLRALHLNGLMGHALVLCDKKSAAT